MADGSNPPSIEDLQAQLIALQEKQTEQEGKINSLTDENKKLNDDLSKARELNTRLFLRLPNGENKSSEESTTEEDSFDKLLDEVFEKYVIKKETTSEKK